MSKQYWEEHKEHGQRMVDYANGMLSPGEIGAVPLRRTCEISPEDTAQEIAEASIAMAGADGVYGDRKRLYEEDFNALIDIEILGGRITQDTADRARANFHDYMRASHMLPPHTSPKFYQ